MDSKPICTECNKEKQRVSLLGMDWCTYYVCLEHYSEDEKSMVEFHNRNYADVK